ncbi:MAG: hypothetical protein SF162_03650 [bacterium]|nr:hypothetical protein [bacterium]
MSQSTLIPVKEAIRSARDYMQSVYKGEPITHLLLEEVRLSEDERHWEITYGFDTQREYRHGINRLRTTRSILDGDFQDSEPTPKFIREYKLIVIDAHTGEVERMQIRTV